jgi:hypothetical protein
MSDPNTNTEIFLPFFNRTYLRKRVAECKLYRSENIENLMKIFTEQELKQMRTESILQFKSSNKLKFQPKDKVVLKLKLKNIPLL